MNKDYYKIGEVSKKCSIPIKTLRYYDEIGLIKPEYIEEQNNYRYYTKEQMVTIYIIRKLKNLDFSLKEIKSILEDNNTKAIETSIEKKLQEISEKIALLQKSYESGENFLARLKRGAIILDHYDKGVLNEYDKDIDVVKIEEISEKNLYFIRKPIIAYNNAGVTLDRWIEIREVAESKNLKTRGPIMLTYYENLLDQFLYKDCDVEFAIEVDEYRDEPSFRKFGGFQAVTCIHVGDYSNIVQTYLKMIQFINLNRDKYAIDGYPTDEFIISPVDINNIDEHITRVIIPIKKLQK
ncbi:DNA-binding transcriptional regulator, MerR family [Dethiosulfatibacter aminovorans DSM 17477]|uniref:DNA-binding transcriptional regulator, MerR family n=1 Tax=Dethiosulfatibacter aminovorans DSM 17477 TaxID=1121476 RepID=A0A1M6ADL6_9FIRM|nr:MerR family transcriptional regulator [Dethiosulfatibacter aminovorans]SHI34654.1 DNA-binding transcriptional regulator, MerR family [Dethiosulfatibacter aminovorans DSM 17477]